MTTIRVAKRAKFTVIDRRTLNDERLSYRARGILAWLLDKPDDWITDADAVAAGGKEGRDAIRSALCELEEFGYLARHRERDDLGKWRRDWTVYETPPQRDSSRGPQRESSAGSHQPKRGKHAGRNQDGKPATGNQRRETRPEKEVLIPSTELSTETNTRERCGFDDFWAVYPLKEAKVKAQQAWAAAIKRKTPDALVAAAAGYAECRVGEDPKFTIHAANWLTGERWDDEPPPRKEDPNMAVLRRSLERNNVT